MPKNDLIELFKIYDLARDRLDRCICEIKTYYLSTSQYNPIVHTSSRIKTMESCAGKLQKLKATNSILDESYYEFTARNINEVLDDVVGYRIICPLLADVYKVVEKIREIPGIKIEEERNYIEEPKKSGYTSYHFKLKVYINILNNNYEIETKEIKAEIQVRTIGEDMIATLDHQLNYKPTTVLPLQIKQYLKDIYTFVNIKDKELNARLTTQREPSSSVRRINLDEFLPVIDNEKFKTLTLMNRLALEELKNKLSHLVKENVKNGFQKHIEHMTSRVKNSSRIAEKLRYYDMEISYENIKNVIHDFAGIKIITPFFLSVDDVIADIYELQKNKELEVIEVQDYIDNPKPNGYSGYHMLVVVPITINNTLQLVKVEILIRTLAQEWWAVIEERLRYGQETNPEISYYLQTMAAKIREIDMNMQKISSLIDNDQPGSPKNKRRRKEQLKNTTT